MKLLTFITVWLASYVNSSESYDPFAVRLGYFYGLRQLGWYDLETPIVVHVAHGISFPLQMCLAYYNDVALDILTLQRPIVNIPESNHNTNSRILCMAQTWSILGDFFFSPLNEPSGKEKVKAVLTPIFEQLGYENISFDVDSNVLNCKEDIDCLSNLAKSHNYSPYIIGSIIAQDVMNEFVNDGWNMYGLLTSINNDDICEANCKPYSDYTGYQPKNNPYDGKQKKNKNNNNYYKANKKNKNKNDIYWQPLLESDGRGFFYRHEHVTPHIGITGKKYLLDEYVMADEPNYDYDKEGNDVILRLKELATSDYQKAAVEFFDDKSGVRAFLFDHIRLTYKESATIEILILYSMGISFAEHEAVLQAWNQKVYYDRVRPTTVIQKWGDRKIETYGGPYQGVKIIKAKYFEPYIRVMPHSEYPSGSACICTAYQEFTDLFIKQYFGDDSLYDMNIPFPAGSSKIETGITPKEDVIIHINDMTELAYICGESRLWGGMHFRKSVDEANRICKGLGTKAFDLLQKANNNASWPQNMQNMDANAKQINFHQFSYDNHYFTKKSTYSNYYLFGAFILIAICIIILVLQLKILINNEKKQDYN